MSLIEIKVAPLQPLAAKEIKQEAWNKHCFPFAISVNIKNDKLIIIINNNNEY
jgi:hypothetical protein